VRHQLKLDHPEVEEVHDPSEVEKLFSASYTTEMERDVMRAALCGGPLPVVQQAFGGNAVELFLSLGELRKQILSFAWYEVQL